MEHIHLECQDVADDGAQPGMKLRKTGWFSAQMHDPCQNYKYICNHIMDDVVASHRQFDIVEITDQNSIKNQITQYRRHNSKMTEQFF